jgi:hypothetical protein
MSRPFQLFRLQQIDSQIDWVHARLKEVETALNDDAELRQAIDNAAQAEKKLQEVHKSLRRAEDEVTQQRIKIEQTEAALYGGKVRNPKELQDLQNEAAALKRYLSVLEDRQLEAMLAEEESAAAHGIASAGLQAMQTRSSEQSAALILERDKLNKDLARFQDERQAAVTSIAPDDLSLYEQLRQKRHGIAVAKVANKACSACGSTLNAALLHAAYSPSQVNRCDACGRILYVG